MNQTIAPVSFADKQPIYKVEKDCIINKSGDITVGFELELPEIFTLSTDEYNMLHSTINSALAILPDYTVVHKQDWYTVEKYDPYSDLQNSETEPSFLGKKFFRHFSDRPHLNHKCYLYITQSNAVNMRKRSSNNLLLFGRFIPKESLDKKTIEYFLDCTRQAAQNLHATGKIHVKRLTTDDIIGTDKQFGVLDRYWSLSRQPDGVLKDIVFDTQQTTIGDSYLSLHTISDTDDFQNGRISPCSRFEPLSTDKSECKLSFTYPVGLNLSCNHIYNQYIFIYNSKAILDELAKSAKRLASFANFSASNAVNQHFNEQFISECEISGNKAVKFHANVLAWSDDRAELAQIKTDVGAAISRLGCTPRHNTVSLPFLLWAGCPGNASDFPYEDTMIMKLPETTCFWALETCYKNSPSSFGIKLVDRFTGKPLHVDISDYPMKKGVITNRNKIILGPSGSGKSFFTNHMVSQYYEQGSHVVLVDVGHSYSGLCNVINRKTGAKDGIYLTHSAENPISFNPFYTDDGVFTEEKVESIVTLITALWKKETETTSRSEDVSLEIAVDEYIKMIKSSGRKSGLFNEFYEFVAGDLKKVFEKRRNLHVNREHFDFEGFKIALSPFYKGGKFEKLLNSSKNLDLLNKRFVVFELDNIKDNKTLLPVVTIIIMEMFVNKMRRQGAVRKMILIEEAWKALARDSMAEYIKYLFKTVRKFQGEAIVVTQEVEDIVGSDIVKHAIINNSDCKIMLDSRKYMNNFEPVSNLLGLTEKQRAQILSINRNNDPRRIYKEVFIGLGSESAVYAVEVSMEQYYTFTTELSEKIMIQQEAEHCAGDYERAISNCCDKIRGNFE